MRFGIFDHLERRHDCNLTQRYEERLQLMAQPDEASIDRHQTPSIAIHHILPAETGLGRAIRARDSLLEAPGPFEFRPNSVPNASRSNRRSAGTGSRRRS
jgi:hypothetical protein